MLPSKKLTGREDAAHSSRSSDSEWGSTISVTRPHRLKQGAVAATA